MFDQNSRYYALPDLTYVSDSGKKIIYKSRRFLPALPLQNFGREVTVSVGDRLDVIANRFLGDPLRYWEMVDSNMVMRPSELIDGSRQKFQIWSYKDE